MIDEHQIERLARKFEDAIVEAGLEWMPDEYADSLQLPRGETPYTVGMTLLEEMASGLDEYLKEK
jgi:hypothetical protein